MVLSRQGYIIIHSKYPIIRTSQIHTGTALIPTDVEYIALSQAMQDILPFVSLMKEIEFVLKRQGDTLAVLFSLFKNPVTVYE